MKEKLNYIFGQLLDNYKTAFKEKNNYYIGIGLLYLLLMNAFFFVGTLFGFESVSDIRSNSFQAQCMYIYLMTFLLPCVDVLQKEKKPAIDFKQTIGQFVGVILVICILAVSGCFFILTCEEVFQEIEMLVFFKPLFGIIGNVLSTYLLLFFIRSFLPKRERIPFVQLLLEASILTIILFSLTQEFLYFLIYGVLIELREGFMRIGIMFILFLIANMIIGPLIVLVITASVRYEKEMKTPQVN